MTTPERIEMQRIAADLEEPVEKAHELARKLGLDPYPVNYWIVDYDEMNQLVAYDGFQTRYPHWRWGMKYDRQQKQGRYRGGKAFEIVNNDNPANAFLQESNALADQKAVITHVEAHSDFFRNNQWFDMFADENVNAAAMLERHANAIREYMQDPDIDREAVEKWIDHLLTLKDNIDQHRPFAVDRDTGDVDAEVTGEDETDDIAAQLDELALSDEVKREVFDEEWLDAQREEEAGITFPADPEKDVLAFVRDHGKQYDQDSGKAQPMAEWQREVIDMLRAEAYYFAAQQMTKVMNEGWACVDPKTRIFTPDGLIPMNEVVDDRLPVSDGETTRNVYDSNIIRDHETMTIQTRRGFELTGSNNHRIRKPDGTWARLDDLTPGDQVEISGGNETWPEEYVAIDWENPDHVTADGVTEDTDGSGETVDRVRTSMVAGNETAFERAPSTSVGQPTVVGMRDTMRVPEFVDETVGRFLGLLVGGGLVPPDSSRVGFTSGTKARADEFAGLVEELFGIAPLTSHQGSRWRVSCDSVNLLDVLVDEFDLPRDKSADTKTVPEQILRSPRSVVAQFLRGLFDAAGHAGEQGAILSTKSENMSATVQLLLTNFGILSHRREQTDEWYQVQLSGPSAQKFAEIVGFGYSDSRERLFEDVDGRAWPEEEQWTDEVVSVAENEGDVYDISVGETHRYAGGGFVNHNSKWESTMMTDEQFAGDDEFLRYADHMAQVLGSPGLNPYKLGKELWEYVENTTNREEVVDKLLRVEGITWRNFEDAVDTATVLDHLEPPVAIDRITPETLTELRDVDDRYVDQEGLERAIRGDIDVERYPWQVLTYEGLSRRHYSLVKPHYRGFLDRVTESELERIGRYVFDDAVYGTIDEALTDVDFTRGWNRMREVRESHNDITFLDQFLTQEFVDKNDYFTYEYSQAAGQYRVASTEYQDVKKKLLLQFTNFGKPTIAVHDGNFNNRNELLLAHHYNGVMLDIDRAKRVLERVFELWGRPVNLKTIVKEVDEHDVEVAKRRDKEPEPEEVGKLIRYDGDGFEIKDLDWEAVKDIAATDVDYDTKPDEWLA